MAMGVVGVCCVECSPDAVGSFQTPPFRRWGACMQTEKHPGNESRNESAHETYKNTVPQTPPQGLGMAAITPAINK